MIILKYLNNKFDIGLGKIDQYFLCIYNFKYKNYINRIKNKFNNKNSYKPFTKPNKRNKINLYTNSKLNNK